MHGRGLRIRMALLAVMMSLGVALPLQASAQPAGEPLELPCVTGVMVEHLGQAMPPKGNGLALVVARLTLAPGGGFGPHTHPGTMTVWVDSGTLDFTLLEDHGGMGMSINRAAQDGAPAASDPVTVNQEMTLNPGDWLVEERMVHQAWNHGDVPTVVILSALVDPALPLVQCVDNATPAS